MAKFSNDKIVSYLDNFSDDDDNYDNWTTSKRKVNHKTRQVETHVSHPVVLEDGRLVSEDGPQVVTCIKEENKLEECAEEKEPTKKNGSCDGDSTDSKESGERILGEKRQVNRVARETRVENMHYHDDRFRGLSGLDVHERAIKEPHALITIMDKDGISSTPRGRMIHYSNKGKKYHDTDEVKEVAKLAIDGSITKEVQRTNRHEEFSEDEIPDETGEAEVLKETGPKVERSSRRHVDYVNDFDDIDAPMPYNDDDGRAAKKTSYLTGGHKSREAFPAYEIDPLLNSLRDEDFKPRRSDGGRHIEHPIRQAQI